MTDTTNTKLTAIAKAIKAVEKKRYIGGAIEIGKLLHEAREQCEHGEYMDWLKSNFSWSHDTSRRYRDVYELSQNPQFADFAKWDISLSALYRVAILLKDEEDDPDFRAAGFAIIEAAKQGRVSCKMAIEIEQTTIAARILADNPPVDPPDPPPVEPEETETELEETEPPVIDLPLSALAKDIMAAFHTINSVTPCNPVWSEIMQGNVETIACRERLDAMRQAMSLLGSVYSKHTKTSKVKEAADRAAHRSETKKVLEDAQ